MSTDNKIGFLDSFPADTAVIPQIINRLIEDLRSLKLPQEEIDEIVLSMDEAITNAVQGTITGSYESSTCGTRRDITIRYTAGDDAFDATIIDHGRGLDIFNIANTVPDAASAAYHEQVLDYASESEKGKIRVTVNGMEMPVKGIGAGLKIILRFMDRINIDLIDREKILSTSVSKNTDGTIFNMKRKRRYR